MLINKLTRHFFFIIFGTDFFFNYYMAQLRVTWAARVTAINYVTKRDLSYDHAVTTIPASVTRSAASRLRGRMTACTTQVTGVYARLPVFSK